MSSVRITSRRLAKEAYCAGLEFVSYFSKSLRENPDLEWLFILTMPNSGSTALGKLLMTSSSSVSLIDTCEGEWLVPSASNLRTRWDDNYMFSMRRLRARWLNRLAGATKEGKKLVIEKSPSNMVRIDEIRSVLAPMKSYVVILVRNPYATCESWHRRYGREELAATSMPEIRAARDDLEYFKMLGEYWIRRWGYLSRQKSEAIAIIRYEDVVADPAAALSDLIRHVPSLANVDVEASVSVKDYGMHKLRNMNDRQISSLSKEQIDAISAGLASHRDELEAIGYTFM